MTSHRLITLIDLDIHIDNNSTKDSSQKIYSIRSMNESIEEKKNKREKTKFRNEKKISECANVLWYHSISCLNKTSRIIFEVDAHLRSVRIEEVEMRKCACLVEDCSSSHSFAFFTYTM